MSAKKYVIIGGGLSGTLTALNLVRKNSAARIELIEKTPGMLGRGIAYHHDYTHQPLNVTAAGMSLFADEPSHFLDWLRQNHFRYCHLLPDIYPNVFVPRKIFGDYIVENLDRAHHRASDRFQIRIDQAISLRQNGAGHVVMLESGVELHADHVILALGNFPPADLFDESDPLNSNPRYFSNPWTDRIYSDIDGRENVLLVGTGLTAVDVVLGFRMRNFRGSITMISRRGRLPLAHNLIAGPVALSYPGYLHPRDAFFWLRKKIHEHRDVPWTSVIDGIRPFTQQFWQSWTTEEKRYFMRRLRPFWEVARHRIPAASSYVLSEFSAAGYLSIGKGELLGAKAVAEGLSAKYMFNGRQQEGNFQKIINCTGPESNFRKLRFPLIKDLVSCGMVSADELGLGINCSADGKIINAHGEEVDGLWCIGPMRKAVLWETTALRELREQSGRLADITA